MGLNIVIKPFIKRISSSKREIAVTAGNRAE
jgi:hypothetical protein